MILGPARGHGLRWRLAARHEERGRRPGLRGGRHVRRPESLQPEEPRAPVHHRVGRDGHVELRGSRRERRRLRPLPGLRPHRDGLCSSDSVRGSLGSYKPVDWTSGSLESIDVATEGELYAKLPLGAATLGGRVRGGEKFHMEYFVSGTRSADTRRDPSCGPREDAGCKNATHFVYAYNLGAFASARQSSLHAERADAAGFGGGGSHSSQSKAEKRGGDIAACRASPLRSSGVQGADPAHAARDLGDESATRARCARDAGREEPRGAPPGDHREAGARRRRPSDCARRQGLLAELDSTTSSTRDRRCRRRGLVLATARACLMLAGQCPVGKDVFARRSRRAAVTTGTRRTSIARRTRPRRSSARARR